MSTLDKQGVLDAFRVLSGEPTMPLAQCPLCSAIPEHCERVTISSMVADFDIDYGDAGRPHDNVPAQIAHHTTEHIGAQTYSTTKYDRVD